MASYFLKLGATGFGGPVVLCEHMRRDLVEARGWITAQEYSEGFALSQLAPGPLAAQLAIYLGWARGDSRFAQNFTVRAVVDGITATAIGAIAGAAFVLGRRAIIDLTTAAIACVILLLLWNSKKIPEPILILFAGVAGLLVKGFS